MAGEATQQIDKDVLWGGGRSPFSVTYGKMMMWFFLVSDALTFSGLLIALGFFRTGVFGELDGFWPIGEKVFEALPGLGTGYPLIYVALMTFLLIVSSVTMVLAVEAGHRNDRPAVTKWLAWTVVGGFFFLGSQAWEWSHFIHGSGGYYITKDAVIVTGIDQSGETIQYELAAGGKVYYDGHHAHAHDTHEHDGHDHSGHDHAEYTSKVSGMGGADHDEHAGEDHAHEAHTPEILFLNKFQTTIVTVEGKDDIQKLLAAKNENLPETVGANLSSNEYGPQQYANFFFFVTGFHGFHVFSGVIINLIVLIMVIKGVMHRRGHYEMVEKTGLYWHFVDLVWVFVFTFFYLV
ncbi:MAG: cytochrome c oxidase subunit 3 [Flavobacteriales bacterium]